MTKTARIAVAFILIVGAFVTTVAVLSARPPIETVTREDFALVDISDTAWARACFAPAHHILYDGEPNEKSPTCWRWREVPSGTTYLTFYFQDGRCERHRIEADFLVEGGADFRCFDHKDGKDIRLSVRDRVLSLH